MNHLKSECSKMAHRECKRRHAWVSRRVYWNACKNYGIEVNDKWYEQKPGSVIENDKCKILDMIVINKKRNKAQVCYLA